jgi:hypothetical protein
LKLRLLTSYYQQLLFFVNLLDFKVLNLMLRKLLLIGLVFSFGTILFIVDMPALRANNYNQTIPTRTKAPPPPKPPDNGDGNGNGDSNDDPKPSPQPTVQEPPTATPAPPTPTALSVTLAPTPEGGYLSTAVPCDANPTLQTLGRTNVRAGPGIEYDAFAMLIFLEVRPILGRAVYSEWWLVELGDGSTGWVSDTAVIVQGYTGHLPTVDPPQAISDTFTPGPIWDPTPNPTCTPPPSPTPTSTIEASQTPLSTPSASPTDQPTTLPSLTSTSTTTVNKTPITTGLPELVPGSSTPIPTMTLSPQATLENSEPNEFDTAWILFAGLGLVIIGGIWLLIQRLSG